MRRLLSDTASGLLAGILIAIGGSVFLACYSITDLLPRAVGALLFSVALLCICHKGYSLFTGKVGFLPEKHDKEAFLVLFTGLFGNLVAAYLCGIALRYAIPSIGKTAELLCDAKDAESLPSALIRAVFCGILMYLAVSIYKEKKTVAAIFFCIPTFILAGFEHSIADAFYFSAAGLAIRWQTVLYLAVVLLGNSLGGMLFPLLSMIRPKKEKEQS